MMLRDDPQRMRDEFRYVQDMGLNTVRLEGKLEPDEFFDIADRMGILVMAGWCCCDSLGTLAQSGTPQDLEIAEASLRDQMLPPARPPEPAGVAERQRQPAAAGRGADVPEDREGAALAEPGQSRRRPRSRRNVTGESGVQDDRPLRVRGALVLAAGRRPTHEQTCNAGGCGGAYGFNTETSMGPAVPPIESVRRMLPARSPVAHRRLLELPRRRRRIQGHLHVFTDALDKRYGTAQDAEDFTSSRS